MMIRAVCLGLVVVIGSVLCVTAFRSAGAWLMIEDPLQPAQAVVALTGQASPPLRTIEAAAIYKAGWAQEVWLTSGAPKNRGARASLEGDRAEYVLSREGLAEMGVPAGAVRVLDGPFRNTAEELEATAEELRRMAGTRVIIVTSKSHTRRVRLTWRLLAGSDLTAIVRYTPKDSFDPVRWWSKQREAKTVTHEWLGMIAAWALFPFALPH
jgi:uncharacterized SAM-binding protein YcdF (DUF218 family)